jgi:hypothetical protein
MYSCIGFSPKNSVVVDTSGAFPEDCGLEALPEERVVHMVVNTPGRFVRKRSRIGRSYSNLSVELAACTYFIVTNLRLVVLFKRHLGRTPLVVHWDDPEVHTVSVSVEPGSPCDLLVMKWNNRIMQNPACTGLFELRLRTPHAYALQQAIDKQRQANPNNWYYY